MGYGNPDLDQYEDDRLLAELRRRLHSLAAGVCPYCNRDVASQTHGACAEAMQHKHAAHVLTKQKIDETIGALSTLLERTTR